MFVRSKPNGTDGPEQGERRRQWTSGLFKQVAKALRSGRRPIERPGGRSGHLGLGECGQDLRKQIFDSYVLDP